jgi:uncharacterized membrane protein required for colicin V production
MIIDIILIIFVFLGAFMGYKKGLINVLVSFIGVILALVLAFLLQIPVANALRESEVGNKIYTTVYDGINKATEDQKQDVDNTSFYSTIVKGFLSDEQINTHSEKLTMFILKGISFFSIFVIVTIIIFILRTILNIVFDLPILNSVNKYGGLGLGALKSILAVYIILAVIAFISPMPQVSKNVVQNINKTNVTKVLYNNNMLVRIIESNIK